MLVSWEELYGELGLRNSHFPTSVAALWPFLVFVYHTETFFPILSLIGRSGGRSGGRSCGRSGDWVETLFHMKGQRSAVPILILSGRAIARAVGRVVRQAVGRAIGRKHSFT